MSIIKKMSLTEVVLPLVRVMADGDLSWSDREKIAAAVEACRSQWARMEDERYTLNQQQAAGMQNAANHLSK